MWRYKRSARVHPVDSWTAVSGQSVETSTSGQSVDTGTSRQSVDAGTSRQSVDAGTNRQRGVTGSSRQSGAARSSRQSGGARSSRVSSVAASSRLSSLADVTGLNDDAGRSFEEWVQHAAVRRSSIHLPSARKRAAEEEASNRLLLPEGEYGKWLAERAQQEGRQSAKDVTLFFLRMMAACAPLVILYAGLYTIFAWAIPRHLCSHVAEDNKATSFGLPECIYIDQGADGNYSVRRGTKLILLIYGAFFQTWLSLFPLLVGASFVGDAVTRREWFVAGIIACVVFAFTIFGNVVYRFPLNGIIQSNLILFTSSMNGLMSAEAIRRYSGSQSVAMHFIVTFGTGGMVYQWYRLFFPMVVTSRAFDALAGLGFVLLRIGITPIVVNGFGILMRQFLRNFGYVPNMRSTMLYLTVLSYGYMYSRFLLVQLDSMGSVLFMNLLFSCFQLALRMLNRVQDNLLLRSLFGNRGRDALTAAREYDDMRMSEMFAAITSEFGGIIAIAAVVCAGNITSVPGQPPDYAAVWFSAGIQLITLFVFEFVGLVVESKHHKLDWGKSWMRSYRAFILPYLAICGFGATGPGIDVISLFCPVHYPEKGLILLEWCDKPSLFQAVQIAGAERFKMIGAFFSSSHY